MNAEAIVALAVGVPTLLIAVGALVLALFANKHSLAANRISKKANATAAEANEIAKKADSRETERSDVLWKATIVKTHLGQEQVEFRNHGLDDAHNVSARIYIGGVEQKGNWGNVESGYAFTVPTDALTVSRNEAAGKRVSGIIFASESGSTSVTRQARPEKVPVVAAIYWNTVEGSVKSAAVEELFSP